MGRPPASDSCDAPPSPPGTAPVCRVRIWSSPTAALWPGWPKATWPDVPGLSRARLLTDLGLDDLAASELDLVRKWGPPDKVYESGGIKFISYARSAAG